MGSQDCIKQTTSQRFISSKTWVVASDALNIIYLKLLWGKNIAGRKNLLLFVI